MDPQLAIVVIILVLAAIYGLHLLRQEAKGNNCCCGGSGNKCQSQCPLANTKGLRHRV